MRPLCLAAVLLFMTSLPDVEALGPVDWVFLVDTSKSMRGVGGSQNIWADVKVSLDSFVREAGGRDTVTIYAFDRDVREIQAASRSDLYRAILLLEADGNRTYPGAAIAKGLDRAALLRRTGDPARRQVVVLFTDGKEDVRGIENPVRIDSSLDRAGGTFIYFVSMGEHEPQLDDFAAKTERTMVLKAPTAEAIRNVAREIRAHIPPAPSPPKPRVAPAARSLLVERPFPLVEVLVALAILALIAFFLVQQQRRKGRLEGELEILRPRATPDAGFFGLPRLQTNEVALSSILPLEALGGNDARLFVRRKGGRKKVWIAAQSGSLRVNDVETPMSELYDADTIEIGDAKVRFNRVGDERSVDSNQESDL